MAAKLAAAAALLSASGVYADFNGVRVGFPGAAHPQITRAPRAYEDVAADIVKREATVTAIGASAVPLTDYAFPYTALPYKVNPFGPPDVVRGPQSGYNICNSTTEGDASQCQTLVLNDISDFCLWGSPEAAGTIGAIEAAAVAYCVKSGHGARVMKSGTITGAHFIRTSKYIQITGTLDQTGLELTSDDSGGELDPHGADLQGNPLGSLVYSTGLPSGDNKTYEQAYEWNNFVGSGSFCIKLCDPNQGSQNYCENRYDLIGCAYNMPGNYDKGSFTSCDGDLQDIVGRYVGPDGQTTTWKQSDPLTETPPYTPRIPASSNCVTYSSAALYGGASGSASTTASGASSTGSASVTGSRSSGASSSASRTGSGTSSGASATGTSSSSGAGRVAGAGVAAVVAVALGAVAAAF